MEVHFLTDEPLDSPWVGYRCVHLQENLLRQGIPSNLVHIGGKISFSLPGNLVVIYRPTLYDRVKKIIDFARSRGKALVYSTDDLTFSSDCIVKGILEKQGENQRNRFSEGITIWEANKKYAEEQLKLAELCDCLLVSTPFLANCAGSLGKPVYLIRNGFSQEMETRAQKIHRDRSLTGGRVVLGYLSGTQTHRLDFAEIADVLVGVMRRHAHVFLTVVGPLQIPDRLKEFGSRVRRIPLLPWKDLPTVINTLDINLAPLDMLQTFNHAKSEIKWLEAALLGVVTIASPSAGFKDTIQNGETGLLANTPLEWDRHLENLINQPDLREQLGGAARNYVKTHYSSKVMGEETLKVFSNIAQNYGKQDSIKPNRGKLDSLAFSVPRFSPPLLTILRRGLSQTARNFRKLVSPTFWHSVLQNWEGKRD